MKQVTNEVKTYKVGFLLEYLWTAFFTRSSVEDRKILAIGETIEIRSTILKESRRINIYLPHGYAEGSTKRYPVIYLLDGSIDEDFIHIAGLVQFGSFSWINMIPESIVVGIGNVDRQRDFTFLSKNQNQEDFQSAGGSQQFINFIEKELQPLIKKEYRTDSEKTIIGQSLGGLLATEILFKQPALFDNYVIISPSLWWDNESLLNLEPKPDHVNSIYIGVGKEGDVMESLANKLHQNLLSRNSRDTQIYFGYFENQDHGDVLHLAVMIVSKNYLSDQKNKNWINY